MNEELDEGVSGFGVVDILLTLAANLKLLIFGPLLVGAIAYGCSTLLPRSYTSEAILALPTPSQTPSPMQVQKQTAAQAAALLVSPLVLDPVIQSLQLAGEGSVMDARVVLTENIKASVGRDGLLLLDVTARTPEKAQLIANKMIDIWLTTTIPSEQDRADLEKRFGYAKASFESVRRILDRLTSGDKAAAGEGLGRGEVGISIVALNELQDRYAADMVFIPRSLTGFSRDVVKQPPTLPTRPVSSKKGFITIVAAAAAGFLLLLWVFLRAAWVASAQTADVAEKQAKLRSALRVSGE